MHYGVEHDGQNLDYFSNKTKLELNGPLMATVVLYLSNATQGGQILFPESKVSEAIPVFFYVLFIFYLSFGPVFTI